MTEKLNLKELERKAFRATFQDGLDDIYMGLVVIGLAVFMHRPDTGYASTNILVMLLCFALAYLVFWAGKKYITLPRMGQVVFGPQREKRKRTMILVLGIVVGIQVLIVGFQLLALNNAAVSAWLSRFIPDVSAGRLAVATIGALIVGPSMVLVAYFRDFPRGYYIAVLFSLAVFLMLYLNQALYPVLIGLGVIIPGIVLFVRFLQKYPLPREEVSHG